MKQFLFRSKAINALVVAGVLAALPISAASADSTSIFATAKGTSVLGTPVPVLGTQDWTVTVPVSSNVLPQPVWNALDFTVTDQVNVGPLQVLNLDVDPHMAR